MNENSSKDKNREKKKERDEIEIKRGWEKRKKKHFMTEKKTEIAGKRDFR